MDEPVLALSTWPADLDLVPLAQDLVSAGVAACVSILPAVQSVYIWQGAVQSEREQQLLIKTTRGQVGALWQALRARHPYDVPEFIVVPIVDGNPEYLDWIRRAVTPRA